MEGEKRGRGRKLGRGKGFQRFPEFFDFSAGGVAPENDSLEDMKEEWRGRVRWGFRSGGRGEGGGGGWGVDIAGYGATGRCDSKVAEV